MVYGSLCSVCSKKLNPDEDLICLDCKIKIRIGGRPSQLDRRSAVTVGQKRRDKIFDFITKSLAHNGFTPCLREIADNVGLKSINTVWSHLQTMLKEGLVEQRGPRNNLRYYPAKVRFSLPDYPLQSYIVKGIEHHG